MSDRIDVLAVMNREVSRAERDLIWLEADIEAGTIVGYEKQHADHKRELQEAIEARAVVTEMMALTRAVDWGSHDRHLWGMASALVEKIGEGETP